jgi:predicted metalloendopeptidase
MLMSELGNVIPQYQINPPYGAGYMVYDKSQEDVKAIIETAAKSNSAAGSDEQKIGDFMDRTWIL